MTKHLDYCTHITFPEDVRYLTNPLFDVNMRLFKSSEQYRNIVIDSADYIHYLATSTREGYKKPHGFSGANAGIPWNIIALADGTQMINPKIVKASGRKEGESNCGSLTLDKPMKVWRYATVEVEYFDATGEPKTMKGYLPTVQHEIDHNQGILITDRAVR